MTYDYVATNAELKVYIRQMQNGTLDRSFDYTKKESFKLMMEKFRVGEHNEKSN
jgi:hypothetical protein